MRWCKTSTTLPPSSNSPVPPFLPTFKAFRSCRLLKGKHPKNWRKSLYYHYYEYPAEHNVRRHYGVRNERYKLIHFYNDVDAWELYDLKTDPTEMHNLYGRPGMEKVTREMKKELLRLQVQYDDCIRHSQKL